MGKSNRRLVGHIGPVLASVFIAVAALIFATKFHDPGAGAHEHVVRGQTATGLADTASAVAARTAFDEEMAQVTARMHETMAVSPTGEPDRDFMRMMIPHHQGAIDMALVVLKHGHDERLKRLAQSIIVEQGQEITYMRTLLGAPR
jgi:Domain of unknown function (DUF305)